MKVEQRVMTNLDIESEQVRRCLEGLKDVDWELAYLAALTAQGVKPLSRWEKPVDNKVLELFGQLGLLTGQIRRTVKTGKEIIETVFSRVPGHIDLYRRRFDGTAIDKSAKTQRFEGFLFGYPPCCIEQYIRRAYAPNKLAEEEQKLLFHWACRDCAVTPTLVPAYRAVHEILNVEGA